MAIYNNSGENFDPAKSGEPSGVHRSMPIPLQRLADDLDITARTLAEGGLRVGRRIRDMFRALALGQLTYGQVQSVDPQHPGAAASWLDAEVKRIVEEEVSPLFPGTRLVGEEFGVSTTAWHPLDSVIIADTPDGTVVLEDLLVGGSVTLLLMQRKEEPGWRPLGGVIITFDATESVIFWNAAVSVSLMWDDGGLAVQRPVELQPVRRRGFAAVAAKTDRYPEVKAVCDRFGGDRLYTIGGTPIVKALVLGRLAGVIEVSAQKVYDAAHLVPAMGVGARGMWLNDGREFSLSEYWACVELYLEQGTPVSAKYVAPFAIIADRDLFAKSLKAQRRFAKQSGQAQRRFPKRRRVEKS